MFRCYRYRLYPTTDEAIRLREWAGASRFVYNIALEQRRDWWRQYKAVTGKAISWQGQSKELTALRADCPWLCQVPRTILENALKDLHRTVDACFRVGGRVKFRSRAEGDAFKIGFRNVRLRSLNAKWATLQLPFELSIKLRMTRIISGNIRNVAIFERAGAWYAAVAVEIAEIDKGPKLSAVGIDRGISNAISLSTGEHRSLPSTVQTAVSARKRAQRVLSRRKRGSARRAVAKANVARLCARASAARRHWLHEQSTEVARRFGYVALEKLKPSNMTRKGMGKRGLNRSILDQGWTTFATMLEYKVAERGGQVFYVNPAYTSQTCSDCGSVNSESRKSQAVFHCVDCGHCAHADTNAAINILRRSPAGVEGAGCGPVEARTGEMLTHLENLAA